VEWFRSKERYRRWEEEFKHIKRDAVMAYNSFQSLAVIWGSKARSAQNKLGMCQYAAKKSKFYEDLRDQVYKTCDEVILVSVSRAIGGCFCAHRTLKDSTVGFAWKEGWGNYHNDTDYCSR
jgi:hypothetical protein